MYARSSTLGILSLLLLSLPGSQAGRFDLQSSGAVNLVVAGTEARYGLIPTEVNGRPVISVSLGATQGQGSLTLTVWGDEVPPAGRYGITESWEDRLGAPAFRASFIAGSVERPIGAFRGESGWVRITERAPSHICGEFEIRARGFLGSKPDQENHYVTVRGRFQAQGDGTTLQSVSIQ